jgi:hypothetical protein
VSAKPDTPEQTAARAWLARPDIEARIKAVADAEHARQLAQIDAHPRWSRREKERRADQLQARIIRGMKYTMRTAARLYASDGEAEALRYLEAVEGFSRAAEART